ncbi:hypothetical protein AZ78_2099 [Lysobacter capsici AZ78]|uniref:Uncharacterized protein n=1 Tax=Lysobacter capsici AZ78 TaxID=1444315 RepID=A0A108U8L8_9GAMM|nr:hypothetical protein AZ78_2099 [Lysobacter capsici AZ78]
MNLETPAARAIRARRQGACDDARERTGAAMRRINESGERGGGRMRAIQGHNRPQTQTTCLTRPGHRPGPRNRT